MRRPITHYRWPKLRIFFFFFFLIFSLRTPNLVDKLVQGWMSQLSKMDYPIAQVKYKAYVRMRNLLYHDPSLICIDDPVFKHILSLCLRCFFLPASSSFFSNLLPIGLGGSLGTWTTLFKSFLLFFCRGYSLKLPFLF